MNIKVSEKIFEKFNNVTIGALKGTIIDDLDQNKKELINNFVKKRWMILLLKLLKMIMIHQIIQ